MYGFNVYEDFAHGEFKRLTSYYCSGSTREEAEKKALEWAKATYPTRNISVMSTN